MIMSWLRSMLGPLAAVIDFFSAHPEIITIVLAIWMIFYIAGRIQLSRIRQKTVALVVEQGRRELALDPSISLVALREKLLARWQAEFAGWRYLFVPHKYEFWPVKASPKNVLVKMPFSPQWLHDELGRAGLNLPEPEAAPGPAALPKGKPGKGKK